MAQRTQQLSQALEAQRAAKQLAETANASERKIGLERADVATKIGYFLRFVGNLGFERRLLRI